MTRALAGAALACALACALTAAPARASEGENAFSLSLGYGTYTIPDHSPDGAVVGFDFERGFSDAVWLRLSGGGGSYLEGTEDDGLAMSYSGHGVLGLTYVIDDTLKYVPYVNLGAGGILLAGDGVDTKVHALIELGLGLDIYRSRSFSYGLQVRFESFIEETAFFTAGARMSWRWGFF